MRFSSEEVSGYKALETHITRIGHDFDPGLDFRTSKDVEVLGKPFAKFAGPVSLPVRTSASPPHPAKHSIFTGTAGA